MKNLKLVIILIAALGFAVTSCNKDEETNPVDVTPNIDFKGGSDYISTDATLTAGEDFKIGITASSNANSGKNLTSVKYTVTSNNVVVLAEDSVFNESSFNLDYIFRMDDPGQAVFKFEVTDKDGQQNSVMLTVTAEPGTTPLGNAEEVYWERFGGDAGTGLDGFGLKWTSNIKVVHAVIQKNGADKLVQLSADAWTSFSTQEELIVAVDAAADMDDYRGVSAEADGIYDDVLGVIYNEKYFMIHITSATVEVTQDGTTIKIYGQSKN